MQKIIAPLLIASSLLIGSLPTLAQVPSRQPTSGQGCDCPYDVDAAGRQCGRRSAYSRPGGASPICYMEAAPQNTPVQIQPTESAYDRYMRIGYDASRNRDYQTALINFRRALNERVGDRAATQAIANMEGAIANNSNSINTDFTWLSRQQVTTADLVGKSDFELDVLRNSIFARYGRRFDRADLQAYFDRQSWYEPRYSPSQFPNNLLTALEQRNVQLILNYQRNQ
ncbi:MAG: YARHG domain-containing protein [Oculatellaceae cyanobacterium bins.114]|nr:YARHG domain-containing protein [Oculatellaceae cyanobacterium bins.114]